MSFRSIRERAVRAIYAPYPTLHQYLAVQAARDLLTRPYKGWLPDADIRMSVLFVCAFMCDDAYQYYLSLNSQTLEKFHNDVSAVFYVLRDLNAGDDNA